MDCRPIKTTIKQVECGANHTMVLTDDGQVFVAGRNDFGQCGLGSATPNQNITTFTKVKVPGIGSARIVGISAGLAVSHLLDSNGAAYSAGDKRDGDLGLGHVDDPCVPEFEPVPCRKKIVSIGAAGSLFYAVEKDGGFYVCGTNLNGQCFKAPSESEGRSLKLDTLKPIKIPNHQVQLVAEGFAQNFNLLIAKKAAGDTLVRYKCRGCTAPIDGKECLACLRRRTLSPKADNILMDKSNSAFFVSDDAPATTKAALDAAMKAQAVKAAEAAVENHRSGGESGGDGNEEGSGLPR